MECYRDLAHNSNTPFHTGRVIAYVTLALRSPELKQKLREIGCNEDPETWERAIKTAMSQLPKWTHHQAICNANTGWPKRCFEACWFDLLFYKQNVFLRGS
jgi:hypothetical protein